jgi:hypothetical protein
VNARPSRLRWLAAAAVVILASTLWITAPRERLAFAAECNGSGVDAGMRPLCGPGDPGFGLDSDFMGDLRQVSVANGLCSITAVRMSTPSGRMYASAAMATYGTFAQRYGTFEARIRYEWRGGGRLSGCSPRAPCPRHRKWACSRPLGPWARPSTAAQARTSRSRPATTQAARPST